MLPKKSTQSVGKRTERGREAPSGDGKFPTLTEKTSPLTNERTNNLTHKGSYRGVYPHKNVM